MPSWWDVRARHVRRENALDYVLGYTLFNDGTFARLSTQSTQWTIGKNFDGTGAFGPDLVTADELSGRLPQVDADHNAERRRNAAWRDRRSHFPGRCTDRNSVRMHDAGARRCRGNWDASGVGYARKPPVFLKAGDVVEIDLGPIGRLRNPIADE